MTVCRAVEAHVSTKLLDEHKVVARVHVCEHAAEESRLSTAGEQAVSEGHQVAADSSKTAVANKILNDCRYERLSVAYKGLSLLLSASRVVFAFVSGLNLRHASTSVNLAVPIAQIPLSRCVAIWRTPSVRRDMSRPRSIHSRRSADPFNTVMCLMPWYVQ